MMKDTIGRLSIKLKPLFEKNPVDVAYLYGSRAEEKDDCLSDYDFGVLFSEGLTGKERFDLRLQLFGNIASIIKVDEDYIDVVDLEEVPVLLQFNIISGKLVYCGNEQRRVMQEAYIMGRYGDEHYYLDRYLSDTLEKVKKGVYFDRPISYS